MTSVEPISEVACSVDGTSIGFLRLGSGPALLFVHGSLSSGESWLPVATEMGGRFTCYVMDRRGRGRSGDAADYSLQRECEDIKAVLQVAGPGAHLLGHSYGAVCVLEAALRTRIGRMALYEPALPVGGTLIGTAYLARERYRAAVASNQLDEALTIAMRDMIQARPEEISALRATPMWNKMAALTPTWMREMEQLDRLESSPDRYKQLSMPTLLLVGTATAAHHQVASTALAKTLPNVQTVHLQGQGHRAHLMASDIFAKEVSNFLLQQ